MDSTPSLAVKVSVQKDLRSDASGNPQAVYLAWICFASVAGGEIKPFDGGGSRI